MSFNAAPPGFPPNMGMFGGSQHPRPGVGTGPGGIDRMGVTSGNPIPPNIRLFRGNVPAQNPFNINNTPHNVPGGYGTNDAYAAIRQALDGNRTKSAFNVTNMSRVNIPIHALPMHNKRWGDVQLKEQQVLFTRYEERITEADPVRRHRLNLFSLQELNAYLDEHPDLYPTPGHVVDNFSALGIMQTQTHTINGMDKGMYDLNQIAILNKGMMHAFNNCGNNVQGGDFIFIVYKVLPQRAEHFNFTLLEGNVSKRASKYRANPRSLADYYDHRDRLVDHGEWDAVEEQDAHVDDLLRTNPFDEDNYMAKGFSNKTEDWVLAPGYSMQARMIFSSSSNPPLDALVYSAEVVKTGDSIDGPVTRRIMGVGAYQRIGRVKDIPGGQKQIDPATVELANFDHYHNSKLGWFNLMIRVRRPVVPEDYSLHLDLGSPDVDPNAAGMYNASSGASQSLSGRPRFTQGAWTTGTRESSAPAFSFSGAGDDEAGEDL